MEEQKLLKRKRKAQTEGNKTLLLSVCTDLAELYFREGKYEYAVAEYKILSKLHEEQENSLDYACANRMIGEAYTYLHEFKKALQHQEIHLRVANEQGNKLEQQRALATIGHTHLTNYLDVIDNPDKKSLILAAKNFMKSFTICESLKALINKREYMDIMSRLFSNLGVVKECEGNYEAGIELVKKSINICKANDIYEQLERGYTALGSLYGRKLDFSNAIQNYNLAIEVAGRLEDKNSLICSSLHLKAEILIKLSDFQAAKFVLLKAYKLKTPNKLDRDNIEHNLRVVAAMCYTEDALLIASDTDFLLKKKLYEKMGDGACDLKNYSKGIEYYKKMLEMAQLNGDTGKDLSMCYVSLAQTYQDNKEYHLAIDYFKKDFEICKLNIKEGISSLFSIAETMEMGCFSVDDIVMIYNQARLECVNCGDKELHGKTLRRCITLLRKHNRLNEAINLEKEFEQFDFQSEADSEESDPHLTQNIGDDIDIDLITDISDGSDTEKDINKPRSARTKNKSLVIKKNAKGETQLHTACINGNVSLVRKLLDQGHVVNIRDNCGWLPIHEACINGHKEVVEMLIEKGAAINDRGGRDCNGMTPLHDAASNGHLEIIEVMLDKGASPIAKTDDGETALPLLNSWRKTVDLDAIEQTYYETLVERMIKAMEKAGHNRNEASVSSKKENNALFTTSSFMSQSMDTRRYKNRDNLRKKLDDINDKCYDSDVDRNEYFETVSNCNDSEDSMDSATGQYKDIMENLRNRSNIEPLKKRKSMDFSKPSALLNADDVGEDWLDDDLKDGANKKRKPNPIEDFTNTLSIRNKMNKSRINNKENYTNNLKEIDEDDFETLQNKQTNKRKNQSTLISAGFTRKRSSSPNSIRSNSPNIQNCLNISQNKKKSQVKLTNFGIEADSTTDFFSITQQSMNQSINTTIIKQMLSIDVRIEGKLFRVPVPVSEIDSLTMKWLADEATKRFYKKEAMKPTLELETKNGAMLSEDDLVSILFPVGNLQGEEVLGKVIKWNIPSLTERYKDACNCMNFAYNSKLHELLEGTSTSIDLTDQNFKQNLSPLCKALNRQTNLYELNLRGNFMQDRSFELLCEALPTLQNLTILNLSLNRLTTQSLSYFANVFTKSDKNILNNLNKLDLSNNPLSNESFKHLSIITKFLNLKSLNLHNVQFTDDLFQTICNKNLELNLDCIEDLDISYNKLKMGDIVKFLSFGLKPSQLISLNIGRNQICEEGLGLQLIQWLQSDLCGLRSLNLSTCQINDEDVNGLLRLLIHAENLDELDLSYNNHITSISLNRILEMASLNKLNLNGCANLSNNFDKIEFWKLNASTKKCQDLQTTLDYAQNGIACDTLINFWKSEYHDSSHINGLSNGILHLSVIDLNNY